MLENVYLYFIKKYWRSHKNKGVVLLLTIILMTAMLCSVLLLNRTDNRRELHHNYDRVGAYDYEFCDVDDTFISLVNEHDYVLESGVYYVFGTLQCGETFPVGACDNTAEMLMHYPLSEGRFPRASGEIVLTDTLRNNLCCAAKLGDVVNIPIYDLKGNLIKKNHYQLVGIIDQTSRDSFLISEVKEFAQPHALLYYEEALSYAGGYYNLVCTFQGDGIYALVGNDDPQYEKLVHFFKSLPTFTSTPWGRAAVLQQMTGTYPSNEVGENIPATNKTKVIQIITFFAILIASISLYSGISVVQQQRKLTFNILHRIGFSMKQIKNMLWIEALIVLIIGLLAGLILGVIFYEVILFIQVTFLNMPCYRGYVVEWVIQKRTADPWMTTTFATTIATGVAYLVPIAQLEHRHERTINRKKSIKGIHRMVSRIISDKQVEVLQTISLICVISATMLGYLYCTSNQKDDVMLSGIGNIRDKIVTEDYRVNNGLDLKELGLDCELSARGSKEASYMSMHIQSGIPDSVLLQLSDGGVEEIYGYSSEFHLLFLSDGTNDALEQYSLDKMYSELFKTDRIVEAVPCIILSNSLLEELSNALGERLPDGIIYITSGVEDPVGTRTLLCVRGDENGWYPVQMEEKDVEITRKIYVDSNILEASPILQKVLSGMENRAYTVMSGAYAQEMGIYQQNYDVVLLSMSGENTENDLIDLLTSTIPADSFMNITTRYMLRNSYIKASINAYATIITIFVFLLCVHVIGYCNVLKLQLQSKSTRFGILRSLGMSKKLLLFHLSLHSLKVPAISALISAIIVFSFQKFMLYQYNIYEKWNEITHTSDITRYQHSNIYMLNSGMWMPSWKLPLLILLIIVCGISIISVWILLKVQMGKELIASIQKEA